jgi:hypothetical protein
MAPAKKMTAAHKAALAKGREQAAAVRAYLEALESNRPKRGRKRTPESIERRIAAIDRAYETTGPLLALQLLQERKNLEVELQALQQGSGVDMQKLQRGFAKHAKGYAKSKGIQYSTWRDIGVPADVLREAGITRGS